MAKSSSKTDWKEMMSQLEDTLETYLIDKAPGIPDNIKEFIVKFGPWISLVMLVIAAFWILIALSIGTLFAPFAFLGGLRYGLSYGLGMVFSVVTFGLAIFSLPGLFKRQASSWRLLYYATLISAVSSLISFNLGGLILGTGISLYVLFQIKSYYK